LRAAVGREDDDRLPEDDRPRAAERPVLRRADELPLAARRVVLRRAVVPRAEVRRLLERAVVRRAPVPRRALVDLRAVRLADAPS
jgi:hypothetical protein